MRRIIIAAAIVSFASAPLAAQHDHSGAQVAKHVLTERAWLGMIPDTTDPLVVARVVAGTPAARLGVTPGDRIETIDGESASAEVLYHKLFRINEEVQVAFRRPNGTLRYVAMQAVANPYAEVLARPDTLDRQVTAYLDVLTQAAAQQRNPVPYRMSRPLIMVDGVILPADETRRRFPPESLMGGDIESIRISRGAGGRDTVLIRTNPGGASVLPRDADRAGPPTIVQSRPPMTPGTGSIVGRVTDRDSGAELEGVSITVVQTPYGAVTARDGSFSIPNVPAGTYTLSATRVTHAKQTIENLRVVAGQATTVNLALDMNVLRLNTVVTAGTGAPGTSRRPYSVGVTTGDAGRTRDEIERLAGGQRFLAGAELAPLNAGLGAYFGGVTEGVLVLSAPEGTPAATAGLRSGDVIDSVNGRRIRTLDELQTTVADIRGPISLGVVRKGQRLTVALRK